MYHVVLIATTGLSFLCVTLSI